MKAKDLKVGDIFTVTPPDPESSTRVCLSNDADKGLRFGFPGNSVFWCYMGDLVDVDVQRTRDGS